jgi:uncharacterized coiled-coil DUF342 family protein
MNWQGGNDPNVPELRRRIEQLEGKIATNKITISEEGLREAFAVFSLARVLLAITEIQ